MPLAPETLFHVMSDSTRLRLLSLLSAETELCVCELTQALGLSQPMISRHLATLREAGIATDRREGIWVHYRLHPNLPKWARNVLKEAVAGIAQHDPYRSDRKALPEANRQRRARCA